MNGTTSLKNDVCDVIVHTFDPSIHFSVCCLLVMCVVDINNVQLVWKICGCCYCSVRWSRYIWSEVTCAFASCSMTCCWWWQARIIRTTAWFCVKCIEHFTH